MSYNTVRSDALRVGMTVACEQSIEACGHVETSGNSTLDVHAGKLKTRKFNHGSTILPSAPPPPPPPPTLYSYTVEQVAPSRSMGGSMRALPTTSPVANGSPGGRAAGLGAGSRHAMGPCFGRCGHALREGTTELRACVLTVPQAQAEAPRCKTQ